MYGIHVIRFVRYIIIFECLIRLTVYFRVVLFSPSSLSPQATLHLGFPRSFSSLWQQAGRAGRSGRPSLSILVCHDSPVDQYFVRNPSVLLGSPPECATLNPDNIHVLRGHLLCAAKEIPLNSEVWDTGNGRELGSTTSTSTSTSFCDYQLWGVNYLAAAASLIDTQDIVVHNNMQRHPNNRPHIDHTPVPTPTPTLDPALGLVDSSTHPKGSRTGTLPSCPVPVPDPLPVWRMHPLHRLGSNPSKDVSLRLIDPITISVSHRDCFCKDDYCC